jgi:S1-C subfamily serine protease
MPGLFVSEAGRAVYARAAPSLVAVETPGAGGLRVGSAVAVAPERVLTACHILVRSTDIVVRRAGRPYPARLARQAMGADLCELAVPGLRAPAVEVVPVEALQRGESVFALGMPGGHVAELSEGVFTGVAGSGGQAYLQTSARIGPGWSGGGLFDARGRLVGMLAFVLDSPGGEFNYAVPAAPFSDQRPMMR